MTTLKDKRKYDDYTPSENGDIEHYVYKEEDVKEKVLEFKKYLITKKTENGDYDIKIKFKEIFGEFEK